MEKFTIKEISGHGEIRGLTSETLSMLKVEGLVCADDTFKDEDKEKVMDAIGVANGFHKPRPPLGLMPRKFWVSNRIVEIKNAQTRYKLADTAPPPEWEVELIDLRAELDGVSRLITAEAISLPCNPIQSKTIGVEGTMGDYQRLVEDELGGIAPTNAVKKLGEVCFYAGYYKMDLVELCASLRNINK